MGATLSNPSPQSPADGLEGLASLERMLSMFERITTLVSDPKKTQGILAQLKDGIQEHKNRAAEANAAIIAAGQAKASADEAQAAHAAREKDLNDRAAALEKQQAEVAAQIEAHNKAAAAAVTAQSAAAAAQSAADAKTKAAEKVAADAQALMDKAKDDSANVAKLRADAQAMMEKAKRALAAVS